MNTKILCIKEIKNHVYTLIYSKKSILYYFHILFAVLLKGVLHTRSQQLSNSHASLSDLHTYMCNWHVTYTCKYSYDCTLTWTSFFSFGYPFMEFYV